MITRLSGTLESVDGDRAVVTPTPDGPGLAYEVMLPAFAAVRLSVRTGQRVTLWTLQFIESTAQGATMFPRLAGFLSPRDRAFFELFVTCKGIGHKRALRAMVLDTATLAAAIVDRDVKLVQTMPEVGKKLAETIVVTLRDKVEAYVELGVGGGTGADPGDGQAASDAAGGGGATVGTRGGLAREALEVLLQLGEQRLQAVQWIDRVLMDDDPPTKVEDVIAAVYRLRAGG